MTWGRELTRKAIYHMKWELAYWRLPKPKTRQSLAIDEPALAEALATSGIPVTDFNIDIDEYTNWVALADYANRHPTYFPRNLPEKSLEHYVAAKLLDLQPGQTYIDIGSRRGAAAEVYGRLYNVCTFRQDLGFPAGINGDEIGGDAASMPVPDAFADAMALHCSFEHFEGDSDMRFIAEAGRVLKPGGRCVIAPLYLSNRFSCVTDPVLSSCVRFDAGALIHASRSWHQRHGRVYDAHQFVGRVWKRAAGLHATLYRIVNYADVHPSCYLRYALLLQK